MYFFNPGPRNKFVLKRSNQLRLPSTEPGRPFRAAVSKDGADPNARVRLQAAHRTTKAAIHPAFLVSVRKHFESFESFVIQSGDLIREGHHRCGRRRTADVTTAANCDIRVT